MKAIDSTVSAKLQAQRGQAEALAIWKELWAAHERAGGAGVEAYLADLLELPGEEARHEDAEDPP